MPFRWNQKHIFCSHLTHKLCIIHDLAFIPIGIQYTPWRWPQTIEKFLPWIFKIANAMPSTGRRTTKHTNLNEWMISIYIHIKTKLPCSGLGHQFFRSSPYCVCGLWCWRKIEKTIFLRCIGCRQELWMSKRTHKYRAYTASCCAIPICSYYVICSRQMRTITWVSDFFFRCARKW